MMDDDWDLHAVVRGCAATGATAAAAAAADSPFSSSSSLPSYNGENSFVFPDVMDDRDNPFRGLNEIYSKFCVDEHFSRLGATTTNTIGAGGTTAASLISTPAAYPPQESLQMPPLQMNMQTEENLQFKNPIFGSSSLNFPAADSQPIRHRRRKNQQMKMVRQMTQEELSADSWAWRKYGQKPIKGSPYPRNYYRCSTSKGCAARKQVERSPNDSNIFIVSYTGEHTHPRPTHRSSLAGSIRNKISPAAAAAAATNKNITPLLPNGSLSSPGSVSGFSPNTPIPEGEAAAQSDVLEVVRGEDEGGGDEDEENNTNIPSDLNDDGDDLILSPPWAPTSSAAAAATFNGGGGG